MDNMKKYKEQEYDEEYMLECFEKYENIKDELESSKECYEEAKREVVDSRDRYEDAQNDWHNNIEEWEGFEPWEKLKEEKE